MATMQLRLTATSLASLQALESPRHQHLVMARPHAALEHGMAALVGFSERVAPPSRVGPLPMRWCGRSVSGAARAVDGTVPPYCLVRSIEANRGKLIRAITVRHLPHLLWVEECLRHLSWHAQAITGPALLMAEQRRLRWWQ